MLFATLVAAFTAPFLVSAAPTKYKRASDNDVTVLQFAEVLEQLETEFYTQALKKFVAKDFTDAGVAIPDVAIQGLKGILAHETAHTQFLDAALTSVNATALQGCKFNFDKALTDVATLASVARVVEAVGVGAYLGGATIVDDKNILVAAGSILTIEARHQAFLNVLNGASAIPQAFDIALTPPQVLALAGGFIQGCSFDKIKANDPVAITNNGTVAPGTLLTFDSPGLAKADGKAISCQMLTGGNATALSLPIDQCIVPSGINGPVAIFLTNDPQPLAADVVTQNAAQILAGPAIAFIDSEPDALGSIVRKTSKPVQSSDQITPGEASKALSQASGSVSTDTSPAATNSAATDTNAAATETSAAATETSAGTATESSSAAAESGTESSASTPAQDNSAPTSAPAGAVEVIGLSTITA